MVSRITLKFHESFFSAQIFLLFTRGKICDACSMRLTFCEKLKSEREETRQRVQSNLLLDSPPLKASLDTKKIKENAGACSMGAFSSR